MRSHWQYSVVVLTCLVFQVASAEDKKPVVARKSVAQIAEQVRKSVVMITFTGRDGKPQGLGTGFVVHSDGLIATNLHVIGEARSIAVQLADGKRHEVVAVHASDRALDLALVKIKATNLVPLELGDSDQLKLGQSVVALGNPRGLEYSVVGGVVSGKRTIDGRSMIQLAIPVEPGNSGGPLVDRQGRVRGIITMKSLRNANIAFAMPINALKPLIKKPNPIPMIRWLTIGALDVREWKTLFGARWRKRAGKLLAEGEGSGFGARSLALSQKKLPAIPFEISVAVKLDDERGAAGLVWHADGKNKHYGFYPTAGKLRLTRFEGPDVFSWKILSDQKSKHYRPGEWNTLKVRIEKDKTLCFVNDQKVFESTDEELKTGQVGLAKFRDTRAEFKKFQVAKQIASPRVSPELSAKMLGIIQNLPLDKEFKPELLNTLSGHGQAGAKLLQDRARQLEKLAAHTRLLAVAVQARKTQVQLKKLLDAPEDKIDLIEAALLVAQLDNEEVDVRAYRKEVDNLAQQVLATLPKNANDQAKLAALAKFMFQENGYHGSRVDYYTRSNSYLNEVIDDREGIPITLAVLYMELGKRLGLKLAGVGLPGHFAVKHIPTKGPEQLIDVYHEGKSLSREDAGKIVEGITGQPLREKDLVAVSKKAIIIRILQNLYGVAGREKDVESILRYLDTILMLSPDVAIERWMRAVYRYQTARHKGALRDIDWVIRHHPKAINANHVRQLKKLVLQAME